jgi:hypothetical protein
VQIEFRVQIELRDLQSICNLKSAI